MQWRTKSRGAPEGNMQDHGRLVSNIWFHEGMDSNDMMTSLRSVDR